MGFWYVHRDGSVGEKPGPYLIGDDPLDRVGVLCEQIAKKLELDKLDLYKFADLDEFISVCLCSFLILTEQNAGVDLCPTVAKRWGGLVRDLNEFNEEFINDYKNLFDIKTKKNIGRLPEIEELKISLEMEAWYFDESKVKESLNQEELSNIIKCNARIIAKKFGKTQKIKLKNGETHSYYIYKDDSIYIERIAKRPPVGEKPSSSTYDSIVHELLIADSSKALPYVKLDLWGRSWVYRIGLERKNKHMQKLLSKKTTE